MTKFNKEAVYEEKCAPLVESLYKICVKERIPFFFSACVKNDENESVYKREGYMTGSHNIILADDQLEKHLAVACGCDVIPKRELIDIAMDDEDLEDW